MHDFLIVTNEIPVVHEGGSMRHARIFDALQSRSDIFKLNFFSRSSLWANIISGIVTLPWLLIIVLKQKKKHILFFSVDLPLNPLSRIEISCWLVVFYMACIKMACVLRNHTLIIDVMDLPAEQSIDLHIKLYISQRSLKQSEHVVFSMADRLWIASPAMAAYVERRDNIVTSKIRVLINAGRSFDSVSPITVPGGGVKFAYAGTLNSGRGIQKMMNDVGSLSPEKASLIVCGKKEPWMYDYTAPENVYYLDHYGDEGAAARMMSCDVGIIPYPSSFYYDLTFNTKMSFYIMCGLPMIASSTSLSGKIIQEHDIGWVFGAHHESLRDVLAFIIEHPEDIKTKKRNVKKIQMEFDYRNVFNNHLQNP